jgi:hypothetical protein
MFAVAVLAVAAVAYAGAGRLITGRVPGNPIGWLLGLVGLSLATATFTEQYALYGLVTARGSVPAARLAGPLAGATASLTIALLLPLILLFPDGRLPSRRWRPVLWAIFVVMAGWAAQLLQTGTTVTGGLVNAGSRACQLPEPARGLPASRLVQRPHRGGLHARGRHRGPGGGLGVRPAPWREPRGA